MSAKNLDSHNRWRNKTVAFWVSPEENAQIETAVRLTGPTKQNYIIRRLLNRDVVVQGNPRVYKALRDQLAAVLDELKTKTAVPIPPVGADGEQPVHKTTGLSITEDLTENNPPVLLCKINPRINRVWKVSQYTDNELMASSEWIIIRNSVINPDYLMSPQPFPKTKFPQIAERSKPSFGEALLGNGADVAGAPPKEVVRIEKEKLQGTMREAGAGQMCRGVPDL